MPARRFGCRLGLLSFVFGLVGPGAVGLGLLEELVGFRLALEDDVRNRPEQEPAQDPDEHQQVDCL